MATSRNSKPKELQPTKLIVGNEFFKQSLEERILIGQEIINRQIQTRHELEEAENAMSDWDNYNSELLKQSFSNEYNEYKKSYDSVNFFHVIIGGTANNELLDFQEKLQNKIKNLSQLLAKADLLKSLMPDEQAATKDPKILNSSNIDIFIVHGSNNEVKIEVARTLEKLGLNPIILHEQANAGKTIIEKFEKHSDVGFAITLLTDDDLVKAKNEENFNLRARQNVILEMGYFIGKLGRERVCPLYIKGVELPSDLNGLLYTEIDSAGHWKITVSRELKAAGYDVDVNKII